MKQMKRFLYTVIAFVFLICVFLYSKPIARFFMENFIYKNDTVIKAANQYKESLDISYLQETNDFKPKNKQDLLILFIQF